MRQKSQKGVKLLIIASVDEITEKGSVFGSVKYDDPVINRYGLFNKD